ncbi:MAG: alginate O-acetyltransferase complex protein AlgI [Verrucomicrobiales bacterium]|jgi:alginate O-acetyltransferase complex protein AlgI
MLFNSLEFIIFFAPAVILIYALLKRWQRADLAELWLILSSFFFYAWWQPRYLPLLLGSIGVNYLIGRAFRRTDGSGARKSLLVLGVTANLGLLGYFKYAGFLTTSMRGVGMGWVPSVDVILPLAISFFTFQQIAYVVDCYRGKVNDLSLRSYSLFVSFFPQLIAGPIVHHSEISPQFERNRTRGLRMEDVGIGLIIFCMGLGKKVLIADQLALAATPVFAAADAGGTVTFVEGWCAALSYSLQLYFDFSGYCDMATGVARCVGIVLPMNFNSPYKARNVIEFWRRWHITLSRFLRDYLYIPLGGNRKGSLRHHANLMITMLLGGLWHGAGWNFMVWGGLHGLALTVNHGWQQVRDRWGRWLGPAMATLLTFLFVTLAWVFFRATTFQGAFVMLKGMAGLEGMALPLKYLERWGSFGEWLQQAGVSFRAMPAMSSLNAVNSVVVGLVLVWCLPNVYEWISTKQPVLEKVRASRWPLPINAWTGIAFGILFVVCLVSLNRVSEFLYFQF